MITDRGSHPRNILDPTSLCKPLIFHLLKRILALFVATLLTVFVNAQHAVYTQSNDFKIEGMEYKNQTVPNAVHYHGDFYSVSNGAASAGKWLFTKLYDVKVSVTLSHFDQNMNLIKETKLANGEKAFGPLLPRMLLFADKLVLVYFQAKDDASFDLFLARVDEKNLELGQPMKLCNIKQENVGITQLEAVINSGIVYFAISPDNSKMLVGAKVQQGKMQAFLMDKDLAILKQGSFSMNQAGLEIPSGLLTNEGNAVFVLHSDQGFSIMALRPDLTKTNMNFKGVGELNPYQVRCKLARDGKSVFIYGTTTLSGSEDIWCNGLLVGKLDLTTYTMPKPSPYPFSPELIQAITEKGGGIKHKKEFFMYNFTPTLLESDNGEITILGSPEDISSDFSKSAPNMNGQTHVTATTTMTAGPIMAFFADKSGKIMEPVMIPRQISLSKYASSGSGAIKIVQAPGANTSSAGFVARNAGDDIVIIYNDNVDNLNKPVDAKVETSKFASDLELAEALITRDRKLQYRKLLGEAQRKRTTFYLGNTVPSTTGNIVFPIAKEGQGFDARKTFFTNWCFVEVK